MVQNGLSKKIEINKYIEILPQYLICPLCQKLVLYSATTIC